MRTQSILLSLAALIALFVQTSIAGPDPAQKNPAPMNTAPEEKEWWIRAAPYGWLTAIDGDVRIGRLSAPVDISMADTLEDLDMAVMGVFEAGWERWSIGLDVVYGKTSQDIGGGGRLFRSFRFEQKQWLLTPFVTYRAIVTDNYHMDLVAGARITILEADLTGRFVGGGQTTAGSDVEFIDPLIGIRGQADLTDKWSFRYYGDIGGFGASSDLVWQAFAGLGYDFTTSVSGVVGYRALGVDYEKGRFAIDTVSHGPVIGLEIRW